MTPRRRRPVPGATNSDVVEQAIIEFSEFPDQAPLSAMRQE
jgi:hypothetical protein